MDTNFFGALWVTQATLPFLRAQKSGHILQVSSIGGISAFPGIGAYHVSKWALEAFSQSLAGEVADFGIRVTLIEPGGFETDWAGSSAKHAKDLPAYSDVKAKLGASRKERIGKRGDRKASSAALMKIVDAKDPPLRIFFGAAPLGIAKADYAKRIETWEAWDAVSNEAQGD